MGNVSFGRKVPRHTHLAVKTTDREQTPHSRTERTPHSDPSAKCHATKQTKDKQRSFTWDNTRKRAKQTNNTGETGAQSSRIPKKVIPTEKRGRTRDS